MILQLRVFRFSGRRLTRSTSGPARPPANGVWKDDDDADVEALEAWDIVANDEGRFVVPNEAVVQMVILNYDGGPHPFHLHGHKLALIANSEFPENEFINGKNYLQRDVVTVR